MNEESQPGLSINDSAYHKNIKSPKFDPFLENIIPDRILKFLTFAILPVIF
jgi:hypothetical protein